jgi:Uma2 family endonuclease
MQESDFIQQEQTATSYESAYETERGKPMPSQNHSKLELRIGSQFDATYGSKYDFHTELALNLSTGKATPDICMYPLRTSNWLHDEKTVSEPPLLALEILSPTQGMEDITDKIDLYFNAGVKTYWVVIPTFKIINIITPDRQFQTFTSGIAKDPVLGIELDMERVFR